MNEAYGMVKGGKLKLKGAKNKSKKHKKSKKREHDSEDDNAADDDTMRHGGWWKIKEFEDILGNVAINNSQNRYIICNDDGSFSIGEAHSIGEGPEPEEILIAVPINNSKIAFKSGYEKYMNVSHDGRVLGRSDAIGVLEQWEPVFEEGKMAILGPNGRFLSINEDGKVVCKSERALSNEIVEIRSCNKKEKKSKSEIPEEEKGKLKEVELAYVKKFQCFEDKRILINPASRSELRIAKEGGTLHESLLDRREKMKSDRYCK